MKKLFFTAAAVLSGVGIGFAQHTDWDLFRIFAPDYEFNYDMIGYHVDGDEVILTYGGVEWVDGVPEFRFGLRAPVVGPDEYKVYDVVEVNGETEYIEKALPVTAIGTYAVQNTNISSFFTGNNVRLLYDYAVSMIGGSGDDKCHLTLGRSVRRLGHKAVVCENIGMLVVAAEVPPVWTDDESVVLDSEDDIVIAVPDGSVAAYKADARWSKLGDIRPFSEYGLDMFADEGYVTYKVFNSDIFMVGDEYVKYFQPGFTGYGIDGDYAALTYSEMLLPDCEYCEPEYEFLGLGDFAPQDVIEYQGERYPVKAVGSYAVKYICEWSAELKLESFDTGNCVETLYDNAICVNEGDHLTSVRLGSSVKVIGREGLVIRDVTDVERLIVAADVPPVWMSPYSVIVNNPESMMLVVPDESMEAYRSHKYWSRFTDIHPFSEFGYQDVASVAADVDGAARYYNLQGMPVSNPVNGIYIKVEADRTSKVRL